MIIKKVNRKVQGVPQSQAAGNPWNKEEEKTDRNQRVKINKQMHESSLFPKRGDHDA